jgi:DNA-binding MarR family transcriptional regulator
VELLRVLAGESGGAPAPAPKLAKALGTSSQYVVAKLQPLVRAGLVSRRPSPTGRAYAISDEGREYLLRNA